MRDDPRRILTLSTSTVFGGGYLDYAEADVRAFLGDVKRVLFVPYALHDRDGYAEKVRGRFAKWGYELDSIHDASDARDAVLAAEAIFVGGGNTFRLLKTLYERDLLSLIRERVRSGMPYMGSSAGSNIAGPTIKTTNDMPIVQPPSFDALGLVAFQLNPHFIDAVPDSKHMGETREERIAQFLEENDTPVLGLREGAIVRVEDGVAELRGAAGARLFRRGEDASELSDGTNIAGFLPPL
ncbi:MAG: dipeptidase PepE [Chthoniobacterales bacterium]